LTYIAIAKTQDGGRVDSLFTKATTLTYVINFQQSIKHVKYIIFSD